MAERRSVRHSQRKTERWKQNFEREKVFQEQLYTAAGDILSSSNFQSTREYLQHGNITVNDHCRDVAKYSLAISDKLHIECNRRDMIRGALLHDYFLYDWHDKEHFAIYHFHGLRHPGIALRNASKDFQLTEIERDIIKKHMWPLTIVPPMCREAWIVSAADKWCSLLEMLHLHKGQEVSQDRKQAREEK